ncbi:hypothetical protein [Corynebacterium sp. sy039]|uniref:hypothetical protein n=1 Tax=Corynebacterium sp. sy039 TaxID=2599641 RepID=UPI0011B556D1|nr:hypothetical protein [Corynebacterium sp. sy039]QDZ41869.1 hypothetical protein FQV43_00820 [Corynebacterium sp. sy039]
MRLVLLHCGAPKGAAPTQEFESFELPQIPTQKQLKFLEAICKEMLPTDPTPTLEEIMQQPNVAHMGAPVRAPQCPTEELRIIVSGTDASLSTVLTRLMRSDTMWASVAYLPTEKSVAAKNWGLPVDSLESLLNLAVSGEIKPVPVIRDDSAHVVAGHAIIEQWENREFTGEIILDDATLLNHQARKRTPQYGKFGAKLVPMIDAPGLIAGVMNTSSVSRRSLWGRVLPKSSVEEESVHTGRALQAGGVAIRVSIDGVARTRPVDRVTFYRHLRDAQIVRP